MPRLSTLMALAFALAIVGGAASCGNSDHNAPCVTGATQSCDCLGKPNAGVQSCRGDGKGWATCECPDDGMGASGHGGETVDPDSVAGAATSSTGGSDGGPNAAGAGSGAHGGVAGAGGDGAGDGAGEDLSPIDDPDCGDECGASGADYGAVIGIYRGVQAFSNGDTWACHSCDEAPVGLSCGTRCGYTPVTQYGAAYQCVEYIRRFYASVYGDGALSKSTGNAKDYIVKLPALGFTCYGNDASDAAPEPDDIVVFTGGSYGHVAIARAVSPTSLTVIQQNARRDSGDEFFQMPLTKKSGHYSVGTPPSPLSRYRVAVWCRKPSYSWADCSATIPCPDGYDCTAGACTKMGEQGCAPACSVHGACEQGICVCSGGYTGTDCSTPPACPGGGNCSGHGACNTPGVCTCSDGYTGTGCSSPPAETCDGTDNDGNGTVDDPASCWRAIYRYKAPANQARCWNITNTGPAAACSSYGYEKEAFVLATTPGPNRFQLVQCSKSTDHILVDHASNDRTALQGAGYDCSLTLGYAYAVGAMPATPAPYSCPLYRFTYEASPGNGSHLFTTSDDSLMNMTCESPARASVWSNQACFSPKPSGC